MRCIKRVALVGGTHGNELSGVHLVRSLLLQPSFQEFSSLEIDARFRLRKIWTFLSAILFERLIQLTILASGSQGPEPAAGLFVGKRGRDRSVSSFCGH